MAAARVLPIALVTGGSVLALTQLPLLLINLLGFGAAGVAAGSIAAAIQSVVYGGFTGGIFAVLQSIGATAAVSVPALAGGIASAAAGVGAMFA